MKLSWIPPLVLMLLLPAAASAQSSMRVVVNGIWIHDVPGPPQGDFWDSVTGNLLSMFTNPAAVYPDVVACGTSASNRRVCAELCPDFQGDSKVGAGGRSEHCQRSLSLPLDIDDPRMLLELVEIDPGQRGIISVTVNNPENCTSDRPCSIDTSKGPLIVSFNTSVQGVVGRVAQPRAPSGPAAPSPTATNEEQQPSEELKLWDKAKEWATRISRWFGGRKDPSKSADAAAAAERAAQMSQRQVNLCLGPIARKHGLESRMPLCAGKSGRELEDCIFDLVLSESPDALDEGRQCKMGTQTQEDLKNIGKSRVYVWACYWFSVNICD